MWRLPGRLVCVVGDGTAFGHPREGVLDMARAMVGQGHSVVIIALPTPVHGGPTPNPLPSASEIDGVRYVPLLPPAPANGAQRALEHTIESLKEALGVFKPSAILGTCDERTRLVAAIAARELQTPLFDEARPDADTPEARELAALLAKVADRSFAAPAHASVAALSQRLQELAGDDPGTDLPAAPPTASARPTWIEPAPAGQARLTLSDTPTWCAFPMADVDHVRLFGEVVYDGIKAPTQRQALLLIEYLDTAGQLLPGPYLGCSRSDNGDWFRYLGAQTGDAAFAALQPPAGTASVRLGFRSFYLAKDERVHIAGRLRLRWHDNAAPVQPDTGQAAPRPALPPVSFDTPAKREPRRLQVASVLDPFSHACFEPECDLIAITPAGWREQLQDRKIDFVLVESAWHGNHDSWLYRVASYNKPPGNELRDIVQWARRYGVPTVFWNKEDPPNFDRFIDRAADFDFVFTTDENCIDRYRRKVPTSTQVAALPFAAQPRIHNPRLDSPRNDTTSFAGTYYADDYEPRRRAMDMLLRTAARHGLDIFDRMHGVTGAAKARYEFPEDLRRYIRGSLNYEEMVKAYRQYRVALNVNSVSDSPTMFSRRVFELLACATPVVSTQSVGIEQIFRGTVPTVSTEAEAADTIGRLMQDPAAWLRASVAGVRSVFGAHTYAHRMDAMVRAMGLGDLGAVHADMVVVATSSTANARRLAGLLAHQHVQPAEVVVLDAGVKDEAAHQLVAALRAARLKATALPAANVASYLRNRHPDAWVAVCDGAHHYGPSYLMDARNALLGTVDTQVSVIEPPADPRSFLSRLSFGDVAPIGMTTATGHAGSLVMATRHAELPRMLRWAGSDRVDLEGLCRTRAPVEFVPRIDALGLSNPGLLDLH